jgi:5-(aminomethyl)-3-furanmethanol phosphate kinase
VTPPVVVKVGGSLLGWQRFRARLSAYLDSRRNDRLVLVVGGGPAVDWIRDLDRRHGLGEELSHRLALSALDQTAQIVADCVAGLDVVTLPEDLAVIWEAGRTPILAPRLFLERDDRTSADPLPHTWAVTSDSIAARLARQLGAAELVLLKSAPLPAGCGRSEAARTGLLDPFFPVASEGLERIFYVNLREPEWCASAL